MSHKAIAGVNAAMEVRPPLTLLRGNKLHYVIQLDKLSLMVYD